MIVIFHISFCTYNVAKALKLCGGVVVGGFAAVSEGREFKYHHKDKQRAKFTHLEFFNFS